MSGTASADMQCAWLRRHGHLPLDLKGRLGERLVDQGENCCRGGCHRKSPHGQRLVKPWEQSSHGHFRPLEPASSGAGLGEPQALTPTCEKCRKCCPSEALGRGHLEPWNLCPGCLEGLTWSRKDYYHGLVNFRLLWNPLPLSSFL
jgi:hypothetical protein